MSKGLLEGERGWWQAVSLSWSENQVSSKSLECTVSMNDRETRESSIVGLHVVSMLLAHLHLLCPAYMNVDALVDPVSMFSEVGT